MARNFPGPFELEYLLQVQGLTHRIRYSVIALGNPQPGDLASGIQLLTRGGSPILLNAAISQFWAQRVRAFYRATDQIVSVTLWRYLPNSFQKIFITQGIVDSPNGAINLPNPPTALANQQTFTFRSAAGGIAKLVLLETTIGGNSTIPFPVPNAPAINNLANWAVSADSHIVARDNGFLIVPLRLSQGENEAIWRKRYRPNQ
jgi:hypothetical protein